MSDSSESNEICGVCPLTREEHDSDDVKHEFNSEGNLVPKTKKQRRPDAEHVIRVRAEQTTAARLAAVLHSRGVLSELDLVFVLTGGRDGGNATPRPGTGGD